MGFDANQYLNTQLEPRTADIDVPALAAYFAEGDEPKWRVRGLSANEMARSKDAQDKQRNGAALITALQGGNKTEKVRELQSALGYSDDTHADIARRMELLAAGSVDPECPLELAVRLAEKHPVTFYKLTNSILDLSAMGAEEAEKKPVPSGQTQKSAPV